MSGRSPLVPATGAKSATSVAMIIWVNPSGRTKGLYIAKPAAVAGGTTQAAEPPIGENTANLPFPSAAANEGRVVIPAGALSWHAAAVATTPSSINIRGDFGNVDDILTP